MRPIAQVGRWPRTIDDACYFDRKVVAAAPQRDADAKSRIVFGAGFNDAPGMVKHSSAPAHRVDLRGSFLRHPMPMDLPIEAEMPEKPPALALRSTRPERVGVRPQSVDGCLPSASGSGLLADRAQDRSRGSCGTRWTWMNR